MIRRTLGSGRYDASGSCRSTLVQVALQLGEAGMERAPQHDAVKLVEHGLLEALVVLWGLTMRVSDASWPVITGFWLAVGLALALWARRDMTQHERHLHAMAASISAKDTDRPHQALGMKVPSDVYARSARVYRGLDELTYPFHDQTIMVTGCGRICFRGRKVNFSHVFAGQRVGVTQVGEHIWLVTFMQYDLGYFDDETCRLEPIENPFGPKVLPLRPELPPIRSERTILEWLLGLDSNQQPSS